MILLDTHVWMWWVDAPEFLSDAASREIDSAESIGVSAISCWEVGMLVLKRRIQLDRDVSSWIRRALARPGIVARPVEPRVATEAALLDARAFPADPADRMIYATARSIGATLVTKDRRIRDFDPRGTLW
jgi:PIN domain nuclease of toxin-antitoxin system